MIAKQLNGRSGSDLPGAGDEPKFLRPVPDSVNPQVSILVADSPRTRRFESNRNKKTKALHAERRKKNLCIYDARELGREEHGPVHRGGRCKACWDAKLESAKKKRREARAAKLKKLALKSGAKAQAASLPEAA